MDPEDPKCAIITFLTGVIQGGASSPRIFIVFINALLEHLTCTGKALGISRGIEETEQFNHVAFMDDVTVVAQDNTGSQILMESVQEFEIWSNTQTEFEENSCDGYQWRERENEPTSSDVQATTSQSFSSHRQLQALGLLGNTQMRYGKNQTTCAPENKGGTRASNASSTRDEDSEGTLPEHGGERVSILRGPGAMESSRT
jgi:hypothetical protein